MNTPNKLTLLRIVLAPLFLVFLLWQSMPHHFLIAAAVFSIAAITDAIDGSMARRNNTITNFGKFLDPLADKILVTAALVGFVELGFISTWFAVVIITREFLVTSLRLVAVGGGTVIAANIWGKLKTISQIVAILVVLYTEEIRYLNILPFELPYNEIYTGFMIIAVILTVFSGLQYLIANKSHIDIKK